MNRPVNILIADRNRHVRELFDRELTSDRFHVLSAKNTEEVFEMLSDMKTPDLMIIDPDLPDSDGNKIFSRIREKIPEIPVVVHSYRTEDLHQYDEYNITAFIRKEGNSIERVKTIITGILKRRSTDSEI